MNTQTGWVELQLADLSGPTRVNLDGVASIHRTVKGCTRLLGPGIDVEVFVAYDRFAVVQGRMGVLVDARGLRERVIEAIGVCNRGGVAVGRRVLATTLAYHTDADGRVEKVTQWMIRTLCKQLEKEGVIEHNGEKGPSGGYRLTAAWRKQG